MKNLMSMVRKAMAIAAFLTLSVAADAAEVVYRIVEYNKQTAEFKIAACGMVPHNSRVYFENEFGATTGNRYNQIPRNREAVLYLEGWQGCKVRSITLSMCSNNKSGQVGVALNDGGTTLYESAPVDFASSEWFGSWVSKDLGVYVDVTKQIDAPAIATDDATIVVAGGRSEGSVYLDAITIDYDEDGVELESPLGWQYEKLTKKSVLNAGDEVMIYRNGAAAADFDGMDESHYLDAVAVPSTSDVTSPDVLRFKLDKSADGAAWIFTDQFGRKLGATGKQLLAWDEGATEWTVDLGYDGATIAPAGTDYGTLRYSTPDNNYARFNLYTSKSLPLPFLYRKGEQKQPEQSRSLAFAEEEQTVSLDAAHIGLRPTLLPKTTTDKRLRWTSSDESVATVAGGFVTLLGVGETTITAAAYDGGAEATMRLIVTEPTAINGVTSGAKMQRPRKVLSGNKVVIQTEQGRYGVDALMW
uniref:Ig-like domain-containing protein n=1 Tax=Prevotella sp. TaxID=59823 RepID=UPI004028D39C